VIKAFALLGSREKPRHGWTFRVRRKRFHPVRHQRTVNIDGATGTDTLVVTGTEFSDDFRRDGEGIYGAGLNVNFVNLEAMTVDGAEGDEPVLHSRPPREFHRQHSRRSGQATPLAWAATLHRSQQTTCSATVGHHAQRDQ